MQKSMAWWNGKTVQGRWKLWKSGGSSNASPFKSEDFPHFFGQMGEAIAPLPPVPTALQWCRCLVVGRLEGSRTKKKGKGNLNNRLGLWKQQLAVSISVSSMHRVVFMHTACSLNTSAAAMEAAVEAAAPRRQSRRRQLPKTFPLIFSRGAKDAITGELEEGYREKREMAIKPDSSSRSTTYRTMSSKSLWIRFLYAFFHWQSHKINRAFLFIFLRQFLKKMLCEFMKPLNPLCINRPRK